MKVGEQQGGTTDHPGKWIARSIEEAHSEIEREVQVRERCYQGWIEAGKLSRVDAKDRMDRAKSALHYLGEMLKAFSATGEDLPDTSS